jgi:hypothetical protein
LEKVKYDISRLRKCKILEEDMYTAERQVKNYTKEEKLGMIFFLIIPIFLVGIIILGVFESLGNMVIWDILNLLPIAFLIYMIFIVSVCGIHSVFEASIKRLKKKEYAIIQRCYIEKEERKILNISFKSNVYIFDIETANGELITRIRGSKKLYKNSKAGDRTLIVVGEKDKLELIRLDQDIKYDENEYLECIKSEEVEISNYEISQRELDIKKLNVSKLNKNPILEKDIEIVNDYIENNNIKSAKEVSSMLLILGLIAPAIIILSIVTKYFSLLSGLILFGPLSIFCFFGLKFNKEIISKLNIEHLIKSEYAIITSMHTEREKFRNIKEIKFRNNYFVNIETEGGEVLESLKCDEDFYKNIKAGDKILVIAFDESKLELITLNQN